MFSLNLNGMRIVILILTLIISGTCSAAEWFNLELSGKFKITPEASWITSWKKGEGNVFYSFGRRRADSFGGDIEFCVLKRNYKPLQVFFGLVSSHCIEVSLSLQEPTVTIPAFFNKDTSPEPNKIKVGHIYMIRCEKIVFLLDVDATEITRQKKGTNGYDTECRIKGRYTVLSSSMTSYRGNNGVGGSIGVKYSVPFIPLSIMFDSKEGIKLSCSGKIPTPIGIFEIYKNISFPETNTLTIIKADKKFIYDLENRPFIVSLPNDAKGKSRIEYDGKGNIIVVVPTPITNFHFQNNTNLTATKCHSPGPDLDRPLV